MRINNFWSHLEMDNIGYLNLMIQRLIESGVFISSFCCCCRCCCCCFEYLSEKDPIQINSLWVLCVKDFNQIFILQLNLLKMIAGNVLFVKIYGKQLKNHSHSNRVNKKFTTFYSILDGKNQFKFPKPSVISNNILDLTKKRDGQ